VLGRAPALTLAAISRRESFDFRGELLQSTPQRRPLREARVGSGTKTHPSEGLGGKATRRASEGAIPSIGYRRNHGISPQYGAARSRSQGLIIYIAMIIATKQENPFVFAEFSCIYQAQPTVASHIAYVSSFAHPADSR
jgi:hypothetical protein